MQGGMYWSLLSKGIGTLKKINPSVHIKGKNILNILTIAKYVIMWLPLEATCDSMKRKIKFISKLILKSELV